MVAKTPSKRHASVAAFGKFASGRFAKKTIIFLLLIFGGGGQASRFDRGAGVALTARLLIAV